MPRDKAAVPVAAILLVALTVGVTGAATTVILVQEPDQEAIAAGFMVKDEHRFEIMKTSGDALDAEPTRLYVGTPSGSVEVPADEVPGIGQTWANGQSVCIAGEGPRCLQIEGAHEIVSLRVAHADQALYDWEGHPEVDDLSTGTGPKFTVQSGDDGGEGEAGEPDLRLVSLSPNQEDPDESDSVAFEATVANVGSTASEETTVRFDLDGTEHDTVHLPSLDDGESTTVTSTTWTAQGGQHDATAEADPADETGDGNPDNDAETTALTVSSEDPGHAYEDVDNDATFTPGTDRTIPDEEIEDGTYHVEDPWSLVIPASVSTITAEQINLTAGSNGHIVVDTNVHSNDEAVTIDAGAYVEATGVTINGDDEGILIDADDGPVNVSQTNLQAQDGTVEITTGGALDAQDAKIVTPDERLELQASSIDLTRANLEAAERIPITADDHVSLTRASLTADDAVTIDAAETATVTADRAVITDEDDVALVSPDAATIQGQATKGEVAHEADGRNGGGGGGGNGGGPS